MDHLKGSSRICVAVTGAGGGVGQAVLRALRLSSLSLRTVALDINPRSPALYTCDAGHLVPAPGDPDYVPALRRILSSESVDALIPGSDPELPVLAAHRGDLEETGTRVLVGSPAAVAMGYDKLGGATLLRKLGFPFARTVDARCALELAGEVGFPLIVKPNPGSASRGVVVVFDESSLAPYLKRDGFVAQGFALPEAWRSGEGMLRPADVTKEGGLRQEDEISCQVLYDHVKNHLGTFCSVNRLKEGVPVFVDPQEVDAVERVAEEIAAVLAERGLVGPVNFQCRLTRDGPKVFELNARFTGITAVRAAMDWNGVDAVLRRVMLDEPVETVRRRLHRRFDRLGMRYVDECLIPRDAFTGLAGS